MALASVALVAASVAIFSGIYAKAEHSTAFLAIARPVEIGHTIQPGDLVNVRIPSSPGLDPIPAYEAESVVGRQASVSLVPGTLLTRGEVASVFTPPAGQSVVGIALKPSQMPASGIAPGEWVTVVLTGQDGEATPVSASSAGEQASGSSIGTLSAGTVLALDVPIIDESTATESTGSEDVVVSLEVPSATAPLLAAASTAGEVALVVVDPASTSDSAVTS